MKPWSSSSRVATARRLLSVTFVLLLVTSGVAPFVSLSPVEPASAENRSDGRIESNNLDMSTSVKTNGTIYVGSRDNSIYALDAETGDELWSYTAGGIIRSPPTVAGGTVYVGSRDNSLYALDAETGNVQWNYTTGDFVDASPTVVDGTVYVGSRDNSLYALDAETGNELWSHQTGDSVKRAATVISGTVYFGSWDGQLYALDAQTGDVEWTYATGSSIQTAPTVVDGVVYTGTESESVYALDSQTGDVLWNSTLGTFTSSSPTVVGGTVYIGTSGGSVYALDAGTGGEQWSYATGNEVASSPTVSNGTVYVGSRDNSVYALDAETGGEQWSHATTDSVTSSPTVADGTVYVGSYDNSLYALDAETGGEQWSYATTGLVDSSPTFVAGGESDSTGSRVMLRTLGHNDAAVDTSNSLSGRVTDQHGAAVEGATVVGYATVVETQTITEARNQLERLADPTPAAWTELPDEPDLLGTYWSPDNVDSYVSTHTQDALPSTAPWVDNANLDGTATVDLPANEEIVLTAWDADATGTGVNSCVPLVSNEYDCQMPGEHKSEATIVVERIGPDGDIISESEVSLDETSGGGWGDPDSLQYATVELNPGFYYIHEEDAPRGIPRKVGTPSEMIDPYQEDATGQLSERAQAVQETITNNEIVRITATTDASGRYALDVPSGARVVTIQAYHAPALTRLMGIDPENVTNQMIRDEYDSVLAIAPDERTPMEQELANSSVYYPSLTRTVEPPRSGVDIRLYSLPTPPESNVAELQEEIDRLRDIIENGSFSDTTETIVREVNVAIEELRDTYVDLRGVVEMYPPVEERYFELSDREEWADAEDLSREELNEEIDLMNQALAEVDVTETIPDPVTDIANETISLAWSVPDMDVSSSNVSIIAHYSNGTTRVVDEQYIEVDESLVGPDTVRLVEYPLGETDPASVMFNLRIAGADGLGSDTEVVRNPSYDGQLPRLDSIAVSSIVPGPDQSVEVRVNPSEEGSYRRLAGVTAYAPNGSTINASNITAGDTFNFTTAGQGVHSLLLKLETTGGETMTLPVRIEARGTTLERPPTVTVRDSVVGTYALVGGLEGATVTSDNGGQQMTIAAQLGEEASIPSEVDVHLETLSIPGDTETTVTVVRGDDQERIGQNIPVRIHYRRPAESYLLYAHETAIPTEGESRYAQAHTTSNGLVVNSYTDETGTLTIRRINAPSWSEELWHWVDVQTSRVDIPLVGTLTPAPLAGGLEEVAP